MLKLPDITVYVEAADAGFSASSLSDAVAGTLLTVDPPLMPSTETPCVNSTALANALQSAWMAICGWFMMIMGRLHWSKPR